MMAKHDRIMIAGFRKEIRPMLRLAMPLALAELGWMAMGFVDTVMAGRLGAAAMGAGSARRHALLPHRRLRHRHAARHGHPGLPGLRRARRRTPAAAR